MTSQWGHVHRDQSELTMVNAPDPHYFFVKHRHSHFSLRPASSLGFYVDSFVPSRIFGHEDCPKRHLQLIKYLKRIGLPIWVNDHISIDHNGKHRNSQLFLSFCFSSWALLGFGCCQAKFSSAKIVQTWVDTYLSKRPPRKTIDLTISLIMFKIPKCDYFSYFSLRWNLQATVETKE